MKWYAILSIQLLQLSEVAQLRWNGTSELIQVKVPESNNELRREGNNRDWNRKQ